MLVVCLILDNGLLACFTVVLIAATISETHASASVDSLALPHRVAVAAINLLPDPCSQY